MHTSSSAPEPPEGAIQLQRSSRAGATAGATDRTTPSADRTGAPTAGRQTVASAGPSASIHLPGQPRSAYTGVRHRQSLVAPGAGLYVHVPFCEKLCHYCDFNTYLLRDGGVDDYLTALEREIALYRARPDVAETTFSSVFIGGGTPTALTAPQLTRLLTALQAGFSVAADAEITIEANPGTLIDSRLEALLAAGVNRLSIGVQSLNDDLLRTLGRIHNARQAADCYERARRLGFNNISLDLMFGLPGQDPADWRQTLTEIVSWGPDHLSCYGLIIEQGTLFGELHERGQLPLPGEDYEVEMYRFTMKHLAEHGYEHYEIANWARPGKQSRHNRIYWLNGQWLGLGPGAHSQWQGKRFANVRLPHEYAKLTAAGKFPVASSEDIPARVAVEDTLMLGLRLREGVDAAAFTERFGADLEAEFGRAIEYLTAADLLEWHIACDPDVNRDANLAPDFDANPDANIDPVVNLDPDPNPNHDADPDPDANIALDPNPDSDFGSETDSRRPRTQRSHTQRPHTRCLRLTDAGLFVANRVFERFIS